MENLSKFDGILFNLGDAEARHDLMMKYGDSDTDFIGRNEDDEFMMIAVYRDEIITTTYQNNHWIRKNYYHDDGTVEEMFEGKWED